MSLVKHWNVCCYAIFYLPNFASLFEAPKWLDARPLTDNKYGTTTGTFSFCFVILPIFMMKMYIHIFFQFDITLACNNHIMSFILVWGPFSPKYAINLSSYHAIVWFQFAFFYLHFPRLSLQTCNLFLDPNTIVEITDLSHTPSAPHYSRSYF